MGVWHARGLKRTRVHPPNVLENPNLSTGGPPANLTPEEAEAREYVGDTLASARALMQLRGGVLERFAAIASEELGAPCE